ncbi:MAG: Gfo/Idh/MocA family oxidoreductase [Planctomycetia bacterium]|nr:Gfo/Idh/MocA family oxidoreductase [Planctomycetia bacterium]
MKPLRVAVVGVGHLGRIHAGKLKGLSQFSLVGLVDPLAENLKAACDQAQVSGFRDVGQLDGPLDAAIIATPTRFHHAVALELLSRGVHLFIEKPLAATLAEASELVDAARRHGLVLQVGHVERFNPAFAAARPHIGPPKYIDAVRRSGFSFRSTDIGVVMDLMIHDIDLVLSLVRAPVTSVEALGLALFGRQEDVANARLVFDNGCVATLSASRASRAPVRTMDVWSQRALASMDFATRTASLVRPSGAILRRELDVERMSPAERNDLKDHLFAEHLPIESLTTEPCDAITAELADFAESVQTGRAPLVSGEQGRDAVALAELILAKINRHAWDGTPDGPVGPRALPAPQIIPGPHWNRKPAAPPIERREAG